MIFVRLVLVRFRPALREPLNLSFTFDGVEVKELPLGPPSPVKRIDQVLVSGALRLAKIPEKDADGCIFFPEPEKMRCERALETFGNIASLCRRTSRTINSPTPPAVLIPESRGEFDFLKSCAGIKTVDIGNTSIGNPFEFDQRLLAGLHDRLDGVALYADAIAAGGMGQYRDLIRLYELAFACASQRLEKLLSEFLTKADMGFTRREVGQWIRQRDPASHADLAKVSHFAMEKDVIQFLSRMEQAAIEILLNKSSWHSADVVRRKLVVQEVCTTSSNGLDLRITKGRPMIASMKVLDDFGVFPMNLEATLKQLPKNWWWKRAKKDKILKNTINVVDRSSL